MLINFSFSHLQHDLFIYNMIYRMDHVHALYIMFSGQVGLVILIIVLTTIGIARRFQRNKRNLIKLNYVKSLKAKNKIKVS